MESMGKVGLLDPQRGGWGSNPRPGKIMIMIKVLQAFKGKRQSGWRKNQPHKEVTWSGQGGQSRVSLLCLLERKNQKIIRIPVMATWDDHDSSVNDGG